MNVADRPRLSVSSAADLLRRYYGIGADLAPLPGERDQNFGVTATDGRRFVFKITHADETVAVLDLQHQTLTTLAGSAVARIVPQVVPALDGTATPPHSAHRLRLLTFLPGTPLAHAEHAGAALWRDLGTRLAQIDTALHSLAHPAMHRHLVWDSKHAIVTIRERAQQLPAGAQRTLVLDLVTRSESELVPLLHELPLQLIHNDANDHNVLVDGDRVCGIIDFGDMVHTYRVCELANALAYVLMAEDDPASPVTALTGAYDRVLPLEAAERAALPWFITLRAALSVTLAACQKQDDPDNAYLTISEGGAWALLERLAAGGLADVAAHAEPTELTSTEILAARRAHLSGTLSTSYAEPLKIVRGRGAALYDEGGRRYLDCVNNVCHVGHCHPRVVAAAQTQIARLNTNTRYLHDNIARYAERLTALLPDPLSVCFLVNSGSEANDLALRLARTHTDAEDVIVLDHAYHGHTRALIDVSPYKFNGRGGAGQPPTTHVVPIPDRYRGPWGYDDADAGARYAEAVADHVATLYERGVRLAGFMAESILGVAGQIELPPGFLEHAYRAVRNAGGVTIADEVQVGFGRVGAALWAFEAHGVVPDIVTLGKPIGNGHPLAAVITTPEIARSFENGMEYFNTFGGNPVSCAVGLAVLDVLQNEALPAHAADVGAAFKRGLQQLAERHDVIGDVRGRGLFLGVELVRDRTTKEPDTAGAATLVESMKSRGVLLSTDGPYHCVLKIKPPLVFSHVDVEQVLTTLEAGLMASE